MHATCESEKGKGGYICVNNFATVVNIGAVESVNCLYRCAV
jgi:hypothetical protein